MCISVIVHYKCIDLPQTTKLFCRFIGNMAINGKVFLFLEYATPQLNVALYFF